MHLFFLTILYYRREYLFRAYGGGPVISFYIPVGMKTEELKSKVWLEHIIITQMPTVVSKWVSEWVCVSQWVCEFVSLWVCEFVSV